MHTWQCADALALTAFCQFCQIVSSHKKKLCASMFRRLVPFCLWNSANTRSGKRRPVGPTCRSSSPSRRGVCQKHIPRSPSVVCTSDAIKMDVDLEEGPVFFLTGLVKSYDPGAKTGAMQQERSKKDVLGWSSRSSGTLISLASL